MRDLRRQALESGKTVSRKARSRLATPANSQPNSPASSRATSRVRSTQASPSESDGESDETFGIGSIIETSIEDGPTESMTIYNKNLADRVEEILAPRKGTSLQGREDCYTDYVRLLSIHCAKDYIEGKEEDLVAAFLKSIKEQKSEKETLIAIKALEMTLITSPSDLVYDATVARLKRTITDSPFIAIKAAAIHAFGICTLFCGVIGDELLENMNYLLEIIQGDGHTINAPEEPTPVTAALEEWGFLCTLVDDMSEGSHDAVEAFAEQLDSSFPSVQIAAGENIALLFEKSFRPIDTDYEDVTEYAERDVVCAGGLSIKKIVKDMLIEKDLIDSADLRPTLLRLYAVYRHNDQLLETLSELATERRPYLSKTDRRALRNNFTDILNSVEYPTRGPRYSEALDRETGKEYGSRMAVRLAEDREEKVAIDQWWKLHRLQSLKRILQGGIVRHYQTNEAVSRSLRCL